MLASIFQSVFLSLCVLANLTHGLATPTTSPLPPSQDPFYSAPQGYESAAPGTVLRSRVAPGNLTTVNFQNASTAYNIVYRTTNAEYQPSWAFSTLFIPKAGNKNALLSYQIPYNTADVDGGATSLLYQSSAYLGLIQTDIQTALSKGWYVSVPDFEGPLASFGLGVQEGHATIDSVRAAMSSKYGLSHDAKYAMWGYSGGSIASEWAAELAVQYAPELNFAGTALGGLVPNISEVIPLADKTQFAGLIPEVMLGSSTQNPAARSYLLSQLKEQGETYNKTNFLYAANLTIDAAFTYYANQSIFDYFKDGEAVLNASVLQTIYNQQGYMGYHGTPQMPLYIYKAVHDELAPISGVDALVERYCGVGGNIMYLRNTVGGHLAEETNGDQGAINWLTSVLQGNYTHQGCTTKNVTITIDTSPA